MKRQSLDPEIQALVDRPLSGEEVTRILAASVTDAEVEATLALVRWFTRRYRRRRSGLLTTGAPTRGRSRARSSFPHAGRDSPDQKKSIV